MKNSFILYKDQEDVFKMLSDFECKQLILAIFNYQEVNLSELLPTVRIAFITFKNQLVRDEAKWQKIVDRNKNNGKLGGRPKTNIDNSEKPRKPSGLFGNPEKPRKPDNDNVNDNDIVNVIKKRVYIPPSLGEEDFTEIAEKYGVTLDFVKFQYDKMVTWAESNPNNPKLKGRNWKMTLMTFVRDDSLKIKKEANDGRKKFGIIPPEPGSLFSSK